MSEQTLPESEDVEVIELAPVDENDALYMEKFIDAIAEQSKLMDKLGYQLITVELGLPALLATVLKLTEGTSGTVDVNGWFIAMFAFWGLALITTLIAVFPRTYNVDGNLIIRSAKTDEKELSIKEFFDVSATDKRNWIIASLLCIWAGIFCAVYVLFV